MHFCRFNLEFLGLGYKPYKELGYVYSIQIFELYRCKKCNKNIFINIDTFNSGYKEIFDNYIEFAEKCGYRPIGELLIDTEKNNYDTFTKLLKCREEQEYDIQS